MFETLFDVLGSAAGGGLLGLIGTGFKSWQERKENDAQREHSLQLRKLDQEDMRLEAELALKQTEIAISGQVQIVDKEAQAAQDVAATQLQAVSYTQDKASYARIDHLKGWWGTFWQGLLAFVDVIRGVMRPGITLYLLALCSIMAWELYTLVNTAGLLNANQVWPLYQQLVNTMVFLTTTAVTWWFGSRPNQTRSN